MSLEIEKDRRFPDNASEMLDAVVKEPRISYTRDFLLSLSTLDACKKLPSGFNESLLSELGDGLQNIDRPRIPGSFPLQGFRRSSPYSSSPPTQGDSGDYSRGIHGKWESRRSDRDSDSQSDRDSDSGRRFGHQSRGSWQNREQDGLLGSGSFSKPLGYATGATASKMRSNEQYQPSKSTEPYHPPRPYKALPHARRETDSCNDETFGSMECTSEDRAEEERKRRASFELMRKEQQNVLQEKQKLNLEKHKEVEASDIIGVLDDSKEEKELFVGNNELEVTAGIPIIRNDLEKSSFASHSPASRPLVPPGFKNSMLDKKVSSKSIADPPLSKVQKPVTEVNLLDDEINLARNDMQEGIGQQLLQENSVVNGQPAFELQHSELFNKEENVNLLASLGVPILKHNMQDQMAPTSYHLNSDGTLDDFGIGKTNVLGGNIVQGFSGTDSASTMEDVFGSTLSVNDSASEHHHKQPDDSNSIQSSKFAQWFFQEETKAVDIPSERPPTDLLSIIGSGDNSRYQVPDLEASENVLLNFSDNISEQLEHHKFGMRSFDNGISNQISVNKNKEMVPTVLTCEDLEQSILSEYSSKDTTVQPLSIGWSSGVANTEPQNTHVDGLASLHLLSLLHKGTDQSINPAINVNLADNIPASQEHDINMAANQPKLEDYSNSIPNNNLTLETLFGTAFMKELQSVEAPVSVQRVSTGAAPVDTLVPSGLPFPVPDSEVSSLTNDNIVLQRPGHDYRILSSTENQQNNLRNSENWQASDDSQNDIVSSMYRAEANNKHAGFPDLAEIQLPEDYSIGSIDPRNNWMLKGMSIGNSSNHRNSSFEGHIDTLDKLGAFSDVKDQQLVANAEKNLHFTRGSYEPVSQMPHRNSQRQQSPWQFQTPQMSQTKQLYHLESQHPGHMSSEMKFLGPNSMFNHDSPAIQPFLSTTNRPSFPLPNVRVAGFEVPPQHPALHQHMQMPANRTPFPLPDFSRGGPMPHQSNHSTAFIQEMNRMQSSHFRPPLQNVGSRGLPFAGNTPEGFQRLLEMELRANSKQIHPLALGRNQGFHAHEADMSFQYR